MRQLIEWARAHRRTCAEIGGGLACVALGWWLRGAPPAPAVHVEQLDHRLAGAVARAALAAVVIAVPGEAARLARAHWRALAGAAALLVAFATGRGCAPTAPACPPAVALKDTGHLVEDMRSSGSSATTTGPEHRVERDFEPSPCAIAAPFALEHARIGAAIRASLNLPAPTPAWVTAPPDPAPPGEYLAREIVTDTGPSTTTAQANVDQHRDEQKHLDLVITPQQAQGLPRFSIGYAPRLAPSVGLGVISAGVRVTRDFWLTGWAEPLAPAVGLGVQVTF
jgi:hypothetical protein